MVLSVTVIKSENERPNLSTGHDGQEIARVAAVFRKVLWSCQQHGNQPLEVFKPPSSPSQAIRGCARQFASATGQRETAGQRR